MRMFILALISSIISGLLVYACGQMAINVAGYYLILMCINIVAFIASVSALIGIISIMGSPLQVVVMTIVAAVLVTIFMGVMYWETNTIDGLNNNFTSHDFIVGGQRSQSTYNKTMALVEVDTLRHFASLNMAEWRYLDSGSDGHWFKPIIFYEVRYINGQNFVYWFSNGTAIFELHNWQQDIWNRPIKEMGLFE